MNTDNYLRYEASKKTAATAMVLEIICSLFGFSGVGIMSLGRPGLGILCMIVYWVLFGSVILSGGCMAPIAFLWIAFACVSCSQIVQQYNKELIKKHLN